VPRDEDTYIPPEKSVLFPIGIQLSGLYFLLSAVPLMIWNVNMSLERLHSDAILFETSFSAGLPYIVQICLAMMCIFKADAIVKFIADKANAKWPKILAFTLLAIGVLIIVLCLIRAAMA